MPFTRAPRPECPLASGFHVYYCEDPACGIHLVAVDKNNKPMVELIMKRDTALEFIQTTLEVFNMGDHDGPPN